MRHKLYSPFVDEVMNYYASGHKVKETAEKYQVTESQVNNWAKNRKVSNGRTLSEINRENGKIGNAIQKAEAKKRLIQRLGECGFDYLGGYEKKQIKIRCQKCGAVSERNSIYSRKYGVICQNCKNIESETRKLEEQKAREEKQKQKTALQLLVNPFGLSPYQLERQKELDKPQTCKVCGGSYTIRQWQKVSGSKYIRASGYCSLECHRKSKREREHKRKKELGIKDSHRARARKFGCEYDPTVTLKKLIERDGLFCAICGMVCNPDDHGWTKYIGPTSPTIDHIIPMAQGGGHIWSNVQIAHAQCNSWKSDKKEVDGKYETNDKSRRTLCRR